MTLERLLEEMLFGLSRTVAEEVFMDVTQVAKLLGMDIMTQLCKDLSRVDQDLSTARGDGATKKVTGYGKFNRLELLEYLRRVNFEDETITVTRKKPNVSTGSTNTTTTVESPPGNEQTSGEYENNSGE